MRRLDWFMLIALVVVALAGKFFDFEGSSPTPQNPRRPSPQAFTPQFWDLETQAWMQQQPQKSSNGIPAVAQLPSSGVIEADNERRSSVGSAFAIASTGSWLTARHVVSGCDKVLLQTGAKRALRVTRTDIHPQADVALLTTNSAPEPLRFSMPKSGFDNAYGIGFPKGQPGAVHGRFMGEMTMYHRGRNGFREQVYAWTEMSRIPAREGSLGGLSGGALLDEQGRIIGVVQAESRRRGRFMTGKPETLTDLLARHSVIYPQSGPMGSAIALTPQFYPQAARQLITTLRVVKVLCFVD